jgi:hypothetical protein
MNMKFLLLVMAAHASLLLANGQAAASPQGITLAAGTEIAVRTIDRIDSKTADTYREYAASLDDPVVVSGVTVLPAHTKAILRVTEIERAGFKRPASLTLALIALDISGQRVNLDTGTLVSKGGSQGKKTGKAAVIGAAGGAAVGVMVAGVKGAAIGAAVGGAGGAMVSKVLGKVAIEPETRFSYKLTQPVLIASPATVANVTPPLAVAAMPTPAPIPVSMGESIEQVTAALGQPEKIADLGSQKIYFYPGRKITFTEGKVSNNAGGDADPAGAATSLPVSNSGVVEPELIGAVYFQNESGKLIPLERAEFQTKLVRPRGVKKARPQQQRELEGPASSVRLKSGEKMLFVVKLANGIDPNTLFLSVLETNEDKRRMKPSAEIKNVFKLVRFNVTKFGESSYGLTPDKDLADGEYAFIRSHGDDAYCFGVGAATGNKN